MNLKVTLVTLAGLAAATCGCTAKANCSGAAIYDPNIKVTDAVTGETICDATVVAMANGASSDAEVLFESFVPVGAAATECRWRGSTMPCGYAADQCTVPLVVSKAGYKTAMASATWYLSGCGNTGPLPQPQQVNVRLTPG